MSKSKNDTDAAIAALKTLIRIGSKGHEGECSDAYALAMGLVTATGGRFNVLSMAGDFLEDQNSHLAAFCVRALANKDAYRKGTKIIIDLPASQRGPDIIEVNG